MASRFPSAAVLTTALPYAVVSVLVTNLRGVG